MKGQSKGQGLPLNTIVIAILVIIVLLVIIVFFTTRVGETGEQLNEQSTSACSTSNPAISTAYPDISDDELNERDSCNPGERRIRGINTQGGQVCCMVDDTASGSGNNDASANGATGAEMGGDSA